jgi:transcriptional regulator GlxA family with amidase domain
MAIQRIFFFVPPGVHLLDLTGPVHVFATLRAFQPGITLRYLKLGDAREVQSSAGLRLGALLDFNDFELTDSDIVFIPGFDPKILFDADFLQRCRPLYNWLKKQLANGATVCSVCTGAFLLGEAGLLRQRECTTHWNYQKRFSLRFPGARLVKNRLFVRDGTIFTSAGVASGIDLALHMVESLVGAGAASFISRDMVVYLRRSSDDPQLSVFLRYRNHLDERVHTAQDYLAQHLAGDCRLATVAAHVNMSPRNLSRRFRERTGLSPGTYLEHLRLERANQLLELGESVNVVAAGIGLKSNNQVRNLLRKYGSELPSER